MAISIPELVVWIITGALAGGAAATILRTTGRGRSLINTVIGMIGALIGGFLFRVLNIQIGTLAAIQINAQDLLAAFIGAVLLILIARGLSR